LTINLLQRFFSYFYPIKVDSAVGKTTPHLALYRYAGRWQLSAATALYSDGAAYRPLRAAFNYLKKELPQKQKMLVLGGGLGSAVAILHKLKLPIHSTLVEIDPQIISWGKDIIEAETKYPCQWINADVQQFVGQHKATYDLIVLDVFQDRIVPLFVSTTPFLQQCKTLLSDNKSVLVFNFIINNEDNWKEALSNIQSVFTVEHTIIMGINRIMMLRNNA
jgi:spermidine synthase